MKPEVLLAWGIVAAAGFGRSQDHEERAGRRTSAKWVVSLAHETWPSAGASRVRTAGCVGVALREPMEPWKDPVPEAIATPVPENAEDESRSDDRAYVPIGLSPPEDPDKRAKQQPAAEADGPTTRIRDMRRRGRGVRPSVRLLK
jgi:hypothetical protein